MGKTKRKRRPSPEQKHTKDQVPQRGFKDAHLLALVNKGQNKMKAAYFHYKNKPRRKCRSVISRRHSFRTMKNQTTKNNPGSSFLSSSLVSLLSSAFHYVFFLVLTTDTFRDEALAASLSNSWLNHEPLSLSVRFCLLSRWNTSIFIMFSPGFVSLFIQGLFSVLERFLTRKWIGFESATAVIECKQKNAIELKWGVCREHSLGSQWIMRIMTPLRFINFYLKIYFCR